MRPFDSYDVVAGGNGALGQPEPVSNGIAEPAPALVPEDLPPQLVYVVEFKDSNGNLSAAMFENVEDISEDFNGCTVYVYGNPTKHVFTVSKRITA